MKRIPFYHQSFGLRVVLASFFFLAAILSVSPIINFAEAADDVTLAWDANSEDNLDGYKLYYGTSGVSYDGTGLSEGDSPVTIYLEELEDSTAPTYTLTGLEAGQVYYFALTAFDTDGLESDYSDEVSYETSTTVSNIITASATGQGSISPAGSISVAEGGSQAFAFAADANYHLSDVVVDGVSVGTVAAYSFENIGTSHTIEAVFEIDTFTVIASSSNGGSISPAGTTTVDSGESLTYTIVPDENYHISDVQVDGASVGRVTSYTFSSISASHSIVATFEIDTYTVTATSGEGGSISPVGARTVDSGESLTYTIVPDENYHVLKVIVDGVSVGQVTSYTFSNISASHSIEAVFEIDTFTVIATSGDGGSITPAGVESVAFGASLTYTIVPDESYSVSDVLVDGVSVGQVTTYTFNAISASHTISAVFEIEAYTVSAASGEGGSVSPEGETIVTGGESLTVSIVPDENYKISDVQVDGVSVGQATSYTFSSISASHSIEAVFAIDTFTVVATSGDGGSISPDGETTITLGESLTISIVPEEDSHVLDVLVDGVSIGRVDAYTFSNVNSDHTISATFNQLPQADAGPDQTMAENQIVTLSGLNSFDMDDGIASFQWSQVQGDDVVLSSSAEPETTFVAPAVDSNGTALMFELVVTDYSGGESVDSCIVNVTWVNTPPVADAGVSQSVEEGDSVVLDASGSMDSDDGIVSYVWEQLQGPLVELSDANSATPVFTAPDVALEGASLVFEVTVTDAGGLQDTASCLINVVWMNTAPIADAGLDQDSTTGEAVLLDGSQSYDVDDSAITFFKWRQTDGVPVELSDATSPQPAFTAPEVDTEGEVLTFELTVTDSGGMMGTDTCLVTVAPESLSTADTVAPIVTIETPSNDPVTVRWFFTRLAGTAWDDVDVEKVVWESSAGYSGMARGTTSWAIPWVRLKSGENIITVTAYDTSGNTHSVSTTVYWKRRR